MSTERWRTARIADIPPAGLAGGRGYWKEWTDDEGYGARWHSVREHLGIEAFGVNACHGEAGEDVVVPHEEVSFGGQQELYAVVQGRVRFTCNGEEIELGAGELLFLEPDVQRAGTALETPTLVLMIGGVAGKPFEADWEPLER
ncbi:MAG TPA: AraC family ligand binding domain-containing protein [Gaiellaceae bacterium]|nr:AraC family ligand binding domain-containing protein [Gaiellaceae bacterium]